MRWHTKRGAIRVNYWNGYMKGFQLYATHRGESLHFSFHSHMFSARSMLAVGDGLRQRA